MSRTMTLNDALTLAMQHQNAGQFQQAEQIYRQILNQSPNHPEALHLLGILAQQVGRLDVAVHLIGKAIGVNPSVGLYHSNLGEVLRRQGRHEEAEAACRRAIQLSPNLAPAHANLGAVLHERGRSDEAESSLREALRIEPDMAMAISTLGNLLKERGDFAGAIALQRQAATFAANDPVVHNNLAAALELADQLPEAEAEYRKALELSPQFVQAMHNLGTVRRRQGDLAAAMQFWNQATGIVPDYADALWNTALGHLAMGDFERGWPLFEWRFKCGDTGKYWREYPLPRWTGFDLKDKTILLFPEQGFGDVIQFARFIPTLAEMGARVLLHMPTELVELMKGIDGVAQVIGPDDPLPPFDTYRALLSLPLVLKTTLATLPNSIPYIRVDPACVERFAQRTQAPAGSKKVGLYFSGRPNPDPKRSCKFSDLAPLASVPNATFFSLQKGDAADQLKDAPPGMQVIDLNNDIHDFADTAAALKNLDLLITIDTAAAHLAGALGMPVWTMLPFAPDYRWMLDREDSPWYPTMRLFRQSRMNDWTDVVARLRESLSKLD